MEFELLYWYWLVFGMVLIIAEIFIPSFTIFWLGLAAILVAGVLLMLPDLTISWQLFIWAIASCLIGLELVSERVSLFRVRNLLFVLSKTTP